MKEEEEEQEKPVTEEETKKDENKPRAGIPTISYYLKSYAQSFEGNEDKALRVFKDYESKEKQRRLQAELHLIKNGKVAQTTLDAIVGKKRFHRHEGYDKWAHFMLMRLLSKH